MTKDISREHQRYWFLIQKAMQNAAAHNHDVILLITKYVCMFFRYNVYKTTYMTRHKHDGYDVIIIICPPTSPARPARRLRLKNWRSSRTQSGVHPVAFRARDIPVVPITWTGHLPLPWKRAHLRLLDCSTASFASSVSVYNVALYKLRLIYYFRSHGGGGRNCEKLHAEDKMTAGDIDPEPRKTEQLAYMSISLKYKLTQ